MIELGVVRAGRRTRPQHSPSLRRVALLLCESSRKKKLPIVSPYPNQYAGAALRGDVQNGGRHLRGPRCSWTTFFVDRGRSRSAVSQLMKKRAYCAALVVAVTQAVGRSASPTARRARARSRTRALWRANSAVIFGGRVLRGPRAVALRGVAVKKRRRTVGFAPGPLEVGTAATLRVYIK